MRRQLIAAAVLGLAAAAAGAGAVDSDIEKKVAQAYRYMDAYEQVSSNCAITTQTLVDDTGPKPVTRVITRTGWTGQCIDGRAEGAGVLSMKTTSDAAEPDYHAGNSVTEGTMLRGRRIGPWYQREVRTQDMFGTDKTLKRSPTEGTWQWQDAVVPGPYQSTGDGGFSLAAFDAATMSWRRNPAATVIPAAYFKQYFAAADALRAGQPVPPLPMQTSPVLEGLLPHAQVAQSLNGPLLVTHDKKIALVFSARSYRSFQNMADFTAQLRTYAGRKRDRELSEAIEQFAAIVTPVTVVRGAANSVRRRFKSVALVSDLAAFLRSDADCVMVVDLLFVHDAPTLLATYDKFGSGAEIAIMGASKVDPYSAVNVRLGAIVLDRQLQVRQAMAPFAMNMLQVSAVTNEGKAAVAVLENAAAARRTLAPAAGEIDSFYGALASLFGWD